MKIARIESFCVSPRWMFVRVETDGGLVGWGECIGPKRVNAVLGAITDEDITLGISGELDLAVIKPVGESANKSYQAVIMPMRI